MNFYELIHCTGKVHCKTCRSRHGGVKFRKDWGIGDADCPEGIAWDERSIKGMAVFVDENGLRQNFTVDQQFENIALEADKMDGELWDTLKVQIRGSKMAIELHPENSPCWKAKQKIRVIEMYQKLKGGNVVKVAVAMLLMFASFTFAASTNENQIVTAKAGDNRLFTNTVPVARVAGLDPLATNDYVTLQYVTNNYVVTSEVRQVSINNILFTTNGITVTNNFQEEDLRFPATAIKVGPVNPPSWSQMKGEIYGYEFSKSTEQDINGVAQFPHSWDNAGIEPHLHLTTGTYTNGGTSVWALVWWPSNLNDPFPANLYTNTVTNVWTKGTNWANEYVSFGEIPNSQHGLTNVSAQLLWNIARKVGDAGDTGNAAVWLLEFDIHYHPKYITGKNP